MKTDYHKPASKMMTNPHTQQVHINTLDDLNTFAVALSKQCNAGTVIGLNGSLGAGKTTFTQHLGKALLVTETIASPTFVLVHEYLSGKLPIIHLDFYRLGEENSDSLVDEIIPMIEEGQSLVVAEWTTYAPFFQEYVTIDIQINVTENDTRVITVNSNTPISFPDSLKQEVPS